MTNEELAVKIQSGEAERMEALWQQVEKLVRWKAKRFLNTLGDCPPVELDELISAGYLAVDAAVVHFDPQEGGFQYLAGIAPENGLREATMWRSPRQQHDPIHQARSFSEALEPGEDSGTEPGDTIPDPGALEPLEDVEQEIFRHQLRAALEDVLEEIPPQYGTVIRQHYFQDMTFREISQVTGKQEQELRQAEKKGMTALRQPKRWNSLRPFLDFDYYSGTGLNSFRHSGLSVQERYLMKQERSVASSSWYSKQQI